jgi:hypothetical protein
VKPLFSVDVIIERKASTKIEFLIKAKSNFKSKSTANNVEVNDFKNSVWRFTYQFRMMPNHLYFEQLMGQFRMLLKKKLYAGILSSLVGNENL